MKKKKNRIYLRKLLLLDTYFAYLMPSCNNIVHWHFAAVKIGVIVVVVVVLASDIVVIDALKRFIVLFVEIDSG